MPHGYTNHTTRDGPVVTKAYRGPDATQRCARETAVLRRLAGLVPVPPVVASTDISLSLGFMPGVHGQDLIAAGLGGQVLHACGQVLRRIHALDPGLAPGLAPKQGFGWRAIAKELGIPVMTAVDAYPGCTEIVSPEALVPGGKTKGKRRVA